MRSALPAALLLVTGICLPLRAQVDTVPADSVAAVRSDTGAIPVADTALAGATPPAPRVHLWLLGKDTVDSARAVELKRLRNVRRVVFGVLSAGFFVAGLVANANVHDYLDAEAAARRAYEEPGLWQDEYDSRWTQYENAVARTDGAKQIRNLGYAAAGVAAVGVVISIWF